MIDCKRCSKPEIGYYGRMFLDRVFSDNKNYELSCIQCGHRSFINKNSRLGQWLQKKELARETAIVR
jgi:hypothetical protein